MFAGLGRWCFRHRVVVAVAWLIGLVLVAALAGRVGGSFEGDPEPPESESANGFDTLDGYFGGQGSGATGSIVFRTAAGVDDPAVVATMGDMFAEVAAIEGVTITSPYQPGGEALIATAGPDAGTIAYAVVDLDPSYNEQEAAEVGKEIAALRPGVDGLQVEIGGSELSEFEPPESELIGLAFAIVILIVAFGSVMAMGLPIGVAVAGVGLGLGLTTLISHIATMPSFSTTIGAMIGLGVGIDYALFIVTRYREGLHRGEQPEDAAATAMDTAGRAVVFAGLTVVISLLGMLLIGLAFIAGLGIAAATTVAVTMVASVTLLPALLGFAGDRIERTRVRGLIAAGLVALALLGVGAGIQPLLIGAPLAAVVLVASLVFKPLARELPPRKTKPLRETGWYRWSRVVQRYPWGAAALGAGVLLILAIPMLSLRLGFSDEGNFAEDTTTRKAYDLLAEGFGPGFNGPLLLTAELTGEGDLATLDGVAQAVGATPGVVAVSPAVPDDPQAPSAALVRVVPATAAQDVATEDLVHELRDEVIPAALGASALEVNVTGRTAAGIDFTDYLARRTLLFLAVVLALSFLLLMVVFRSLLVPLKAVIMNLLSITAAYGVVVAIFQWGWFAGLFGITSGAPIEPFIPMMMFAVVFGLSMDYEVFLLSRIKEEFDRTGDAIESVADGLAATARVISAAAAIMIVVFGSFVFEDDRIIKLFGTGLATAVFLDATLVRMLLVPATMELLGDRNWWLPGWLDRILPRIDVEGGGSAGHGGASQEAPTSPEHARIGAGVGE